MFCNVFDVMQCERQGNGRDHGVAYLLKNQISSQKTHSFEQIVVVRNQSGRPVENR